VLIYGIVNRKNRKERSLQAFCRALLPFRPDDLGTPADTARVTGRALRSPGSEMDTFLLSLRNGIRGSNVSGRGSYA
jgi:hypothetical protein